MSPTDKNHQAFLARQHRLAASLVLHLQEFQDLLEAGQITRHGVAVCCHVESLVALLERYQDGTATLVFRPEWNVRP